MPGWFLVVAGATIAVYSGQAEPYVSAASLPEGPGFMFGVPAVALVGGWIQGAMADEAETELDERIPASPGRVEVETVACSTTAIECGGSSGGCRPRAPPRRRRPSRGRARATAVASPTPWSWVDKQARSMEFGSR